VFRKSLFSNQDSSDGNSDSGTSTANNNKNGAASQEELDPVAWRRGAEYRRIQKEAMSAIETDMAALEQSVLSREQAIAFAKEQPPKSPIHGEVHVRTVICSQCSAIMTSSEIAMEESKGKGSNNMICRECHLSTMEKRNSSPFLMGRSESDGGGIHSRSSGPRTEFYSAGISTLNDGASSKKEPRSGAVSPLTESIANERKIPIHPSDPITWRNQFTKAMQSRVSPKDAFINRNNTTEVQVSHHQDEVYPGKIDAGAKNVTIINLSSSVSSQPEFQDLASRTNRYTNRISDLERRRQDFQVNVWDAQYASALHRLNSIPKLEGSAEPDSELVFNNAPTRIENRDQTSKMKDDIIGMRRRYEERIESLLNKVSDLQSQLNTNQRELAKADAGKSHASQPKKSRLKVLREIVEKGELDDIPF
jgi:hypothetical protein